MKTILFIIIASIFSIGNGEQNITKAKQLIVQKKYHQAISILENKADPKARYYEGWCYYKLSNCVKAVEQFNLFISNYEGVGTAKWKQEALSNIASCGGALTPQLSTTEDDDEELQNDFADGIEDTLISNPSENSPSPTKTTKEPLRTDIADVVANNSSSASPQLSTTEDEVETDFAEDVGEDLVKSTSDSSSPTKNSQVKTDFPKDKKEIEKSLFFESKDLRNHYKVLFDIRSEPDKQYISLSQLGPVYSEKISPTKYAYYIGHYSNVDKALKMAKSVKAKGFNESRVMLFDSGQLIEDNVNPYDDYNSNDKKYVVLFHVFKSSKLDVQRLSHLGEIKIKNKGDDDSFTSYSIGQFDNLEDAKSLLNKVNKAGIKTAYIGADKN